MKGDKANKQDAISILKKDHGRVQKIFQDFDKAQDQKTKQKLVETACNELAIHSQIEEELFYPAVRQALGDSKLVEEASVEHESASQLINKLQEMQPGQEKYEAVFTVLGEYVNHHITEEEDEMFPKIKKSNLDLEALGQQIMERKEQLKVGIGLAAI
ncbi:MAG: hemerythrin domain-containing protein [Candidatus Competibacteraceae bacterium]